MNAEGSRQQAESGLTDLRREQWEVKKWFSRFALCAPRFAK